MLNLFEELRGLIDALDERRIEYALCGGVANAIWCVPRATVDIELLVEPGDAAGVETIASALGYIVGDGGISKRHAGGDVLALNLLQVTPAVSELWTTRSRVAWEHGTISVVNREATRKIGRWPRIIVEADAPAEDMSPHAVTVRLMRVAQLRNLCLALDKAKPVATPPPNENARG